jgi:hypothetical protein
VPLCPHNPEVAGSCPRHQEVGGQRSDRPEQCRAFGCFPAVCPSDVALERGSGVRQFRAAPKLERSELEDDAGRDIAGQDVVDGLVDLVDLALDGEHLGAVGGVQGEDVAEVVRVPTIEPLTGLPLMTVSKIGRLEVALSAGNATYTRPGTGSCSATRPQTPAEGEYIGPAVVLDADERVGTQTCVRRADCAGEDCRLGGKASDCSPTPGGQPRSHAGRK